MERGIYFDAWFSESYCYHPSMPPRRLKMLDDIEAMRGTMLVWAGLGGGSISLPYLEGEAYGEVPERFRQYGFVNDSEFVVQCNERGIAFFGIVFESQAWEFPAEVADGKVLAQNETRGVGERRWVGLREFSSDTGPADWKPFRHYFPAGLVNSDGDQVTDLWEEVACRDLLGNPLHAHWVEVPVRDHACYHADRNNPVWREYLKAIIRIQVDAGVAGIQLDETDSPMSALRYGGCFCKDCVKGFRQHLVALTAVPAEIAGMDLASFDYRQWLLSQGHTAGDAPQSLPLYQHYVRFLQLSITRTYAEVAGYAREYARSRGRDIRIGGNFYDLAPYYDGLVGHADVVITEMGNTRYQQPWWFRHGVGMARGRPLIAVENPYGGIIPELLEQLKSGRSYDRFRLTIFEASAMGANMTLPYGAWLGSEIEDSYSAPRWLARECGQFLAEIDAFIVPESYNETAVLFSVRSTLRATIDSDQFSDEGRFFVFEGSSDLPPASYWPVVEHLSRSGVPFDVVVVPDVELRADDIDAGDLSGYRVLVLPDCWGVNRHQHDAVVQFLDSGGHVVVHGSYGLEIGADRAAQVLSHPGTVVVQQIDALAQHTGAQVVADLGPKAAINSARLADGSAAVHLVNFDYREETDRVEARSDLALAVRLGGVHASRATVHSPTRPPVEIAVSEDQGRLSFTVPELATYAVVHLH
jgi:hypothetical protein